MRLGLKCSTRDLDTILALGPSFIETFLGPRDLTDIDGLADRFGAAGVPVVVHVPEYHGESFIDLASPDADVRAVSLEAVRKCIELADRLRSPHIVLHPGGMAEGRIDRQKAIVRLKRSLEELSFDRFYLENMPWFYFKARGIDGMTRQVKSSIMIEVKDFGQVRDLIAGMTLDICHGFLSTREGSMRNLLALFDEYPEMPRYLHLSDAAPPEGEGLQLGKGAIDLDAVVARIKGRGKDWWGIPEIMDGHKDGGKEFAVALSYLGRRGLSIQKKQALH